MSVDSITKYRVPIDTLRAMAAQAYGADQVPAGTDWAEELTFGQFNIAYRLRLRDGRSAALKIAPSPEVEVMTYERDVMGTELAALALISAQTSVPVPQVHHADASHALCPSDWFTMSWIDGENLAVVDPALPPDRREAYGVAFGRANAEINAVVGPGFGDLRAPADPTWRAAFVRMVEEVLADGERRRVDLGTSYAGIRRVVAAHAGSLDEVTEPRLVEWDLWPGNVLVRDDRIVGILDHERVFWGDPLIEWGFNGLAQPDFGDPEPFRRGYGRPPLTPTELVRRRLYGVHLALIMIIETVYRAYPDDHARRWAQAQLDHVLTALG